MARSSMELFFTRYLWVPVAGAVIGLGVAVGTGFALFSLKPVYEAHVPFQVIGPAAVVGESAPETTPMRTPEEVQQIIARQQFIFQQEKFLDDVLRSAEFHPADKPSKEIGWLTENKRNPMAALKRDLVLVPHVEAASFEIRMTARDKAEAYAIVLAAVKIYKERLLSDSQRRKSAFVATVESATREAQADFRLKNDALAEYARINGIDVVKSRFDIEKVALQALNQDFTRADAAASGAEQRYQVIQRSRADGREMPLPADVQQEVERDPVLAALITARLAMEHEKAQATSRLPQDQQRMTEINARLHAIDAQTAERQKQLAERATRAYESRLQEEAQSLRFQASYVGVIQKKKEDIVTNIAQNLIVWDQRWEEVKEAQELVGKLRAQLRMAQANRSVDDTVVVQLDDPLMPQHPVSFPFERYLLYGAIVGLALGIFTAVPLSIGQNQRERANRSGVTT